MDAYLNADNLLLTGETLGQLDMYPYFDFAHYVLSCLMVKDDLATAAQSFSRRHPASLWLSSMMMCFSGSIIVNLLMGQNVLAPFKNHDDVLLATLAWYLVFYSPFDIVYKLTKRTPFKVALVTLKEIHRTHKIYDGVHSTAKAHPGAWIVIVVCGSLKGAAAGIMRTAEQLVRGVWAPAGNELLRPTFTTKACVLAAIVFAAESKRGLLPAPHDIIFLAVVAFFLYFKFSAMFLGIVDPLAPFENIACALFMGGIWDAISRAWQASRQARAAIYANGQAMADKEEKAGKKE